MYLSRILDWLWMQTLHDCTGKKEFCILFAALKSNAGPWQEWAVAPKAYIVCITAMLCMRLSLYWLNKA